MRNFTNRIILVVSFLIFGTNYVYSQFSGISENYNIDGYWGDWKFRIGEKIYGSYNGFVLYSDHPSEYRFKFTINGIHNPTKKQIKLRYKKDIWWEYNGTVEYYVREDCPTIKDVLKKYGGPVFNTKWESVGNPVVKRTAKAIIRIAPYKKRPKVYNFIFDGIGYAIDLRDIYFKQ